MSEARNQYTLGYTPADRRRSHGVAYRSIEVIVHRPGLKIIAKDGYYALPAAVKSVGVFFSASAAPLCREGVT